MGCFHPEERAKTECYVKRRRNNRCLEKFYDAKYIDIRDGKKRSGSQIGCNRTNRRESRRSDKNERIYRGQKVSKGRRSIRRQRYNIQPGDTLLYNGQTYTATGCHCNGTRVLIKDGISKSGKSVAVSKTEVLRHANGWLLLN